MPALSNPDDSPAAGLARMPPAVQDAVAICAAALGPLDDLDQRTVVACLMIAVREGGLTELGAPRLH